MTATLSSRERHTLIGSIRRLVVVAAAAVAATLVWAILEIGFDLDLRAPAMGGSPGFDIGAWSVLGASLGAGLAGWASLAALERWSSRGRRIWRALAATVLVVSLGGPLSGTGLDYAHRLALVGLHLLVAAVLIAGFTRYGGRR